MRVISIIISLGIVALFAIMFIGYTLFIYPVEKFRQKIDPDVKKIKENSPATNIR